MTCFFRAEYKAHIEIPDLEFEFIKKCCERHYDYKIQSLVQVGGFLYGLTNRREWSNREDKVCDLSFREIDLLLKSLEMSRELLSYHISAAFRRICKEMSKQNHEHNKKLEEQSLLKFIKT